MKTGVFSRVQRVGNPLWRYANNTVERRLPTGAQDAIPAPPQELNQTVRDLVAWKNVRAGLRLED